MNKTILLICMFALIYVGVAFGTTPSSVSGKPSIYDNWNTAVYELGLVAFYRFDNESAVGENDTHVYDWTLPQNNGTNINSVYNLTNKILGESSMNFDGNGDYVDGLTIGDTGVGGNFSTNSTISLWVLANNVVTDDMILTKEDDDDTGYMQGSLGIRNANIHYKEHKDDGATSIISSVTLEVRVWYHLVVMSNETHTSIFTNGTQTDTSNSVSGFRHINSLGGDPATSENYFDGIMDEVMIFNRSLSPEEISNLYIQQRDDCVIPYEDMNIISDTTFCSGTYNLVDAGDDGVVVIGSNDITLDCNGAVLQGNDGASSIGIISGNDNVVIKNCHIQDYATNIRVNGGFNNITNNTITSCNGALASSGIFYNGAHDGYITGNNLSLDGTCDYGIRIIYSDRNVVDNNHLEAVDRGIYVALGDDTVISNNYIFNATTDIDWYQIAIYVHRVLDGSTRSRTGKNNANITNNTIVKAGAGGIVLHGSRYSIVSGNNISMVNLSDIGEGADYGNQVDMGGQPNCAIFATERWKGQLGNGAEVTSLSYSFNNNMSVNYTIIENNIFQDDVQCYLYTQGAFNLTHDLTDYWTSSFRYPEEFIDETTIYIPNSVDSLWTYRDSPTFPFSDNITLWFSTPATFPFDLIRYSYTIAKDIKSFRQWNNYDLGKNLIINDTSTTLYNLTLLNNGSIQFIYNGRKDFQVVNNTITIKGMTLPYNYIYDVTNDVLIASNVNEYTLTIAPNQEIQVGDFASLVIHLSSVHNSSQEIIGSINTIISFLPIIILIIIGGIIIMLINFAKGGEGVVNFSGVQEMIPFIIAIAIIITIAILILNRLPTI